MAEAPNTDHDVQVTCYGDHPSQFFEHWKTPDPVGQVVVIHGGYWRNRYGLDLMHPMCGRLVNMGLEVLNIEYRRIGDVEEPWSAMAADIEKCLTHTNPTIPLTIIGHSAGGQLALWAATRAIVGPVELVIALAPVCDLRAADQQQLSDHATKELFGDDESLRRTRLDSACPTQLLPSGVPQLIVHGKADVDVPPEFAQAYVSEATKQGDRVALIAPENVDHFHVIDPTSKVWNQIEHIILQKEGRLPR